MTKKHRKSEQQAVQKVIQEKKGGKWEGKGKQKSQVGLLANKVESDKKFIVEDNKESKKSQHLAEGEAHWKRRRNLKGERTKP